MTKLFELLNEDSIKDISKISINIGDVFRIKMNNTNGINPKKGDNFRNKFFIVLGSDDEGMIYGGVIINSNINPNIPPSVKYLHMPIKCSKYPFLEHNSFVDCSQLKTAEARKFNSWKFLGSLVEDDVQLIIGTIQESPMETVAHLAIFGL